MSKLLSDKAAHLMTGEAAGAAIRMVTRIVLVNIWLHDKNMVGLWQMLMQTINGPVVSIFALGLPGSLIYFVSRAGKRERSAYIAQAMIALFVLGVLAGAALVVSAPWISALYKTPELTGLLPLFAVFVLFEISVTYTRRLFVLYERTLIAAGLIILDSLGLLVCFALPAWMGEGLDTCVIWLDVFAGARMVITTFLALQGLQWGNLRLSWRLFRRQMAYAAPLGLSTAVPAIAGRADKMIMPFYLTTDRFAVYSIGAMQIPFAETIGTSIATVISPRIAVMHRDGDGAGLLKLWHDAVIRASILLLPLFALFMAVSDKAFLLLFTDKYADGVWLFRICLFVVPMFAAMQANVLAALGRTKFIFGVSVCRTLLTIGATIASIYLMGFYGPPVAMVAVGLLARAAMFCRIKRELKIEWADIWPVRRWLAVLSVALISGVVAWGASRALPGRLEACLLAGVVMSAVYVPLLFAFGLIDEKDRELIRHNWKRIRRLFRRKGRE